MTQILTVNKNDLSEKIGTVSKKRIFQVLQGIRLLTDPERWIKFPGDIDTLTRSINIKT